MSSCDLFIKMNWYIAGTWVSGKLVRKCLRFGKCAQNLSQILLSEFRGLHKCGQEGTKEWVIPQSPRIAPLGTGLLQGAVRRPRDRIEGFFGFGV